MSPSNSFTETFTGLSDFLESLPEFTEEFPTSRLAYTVMFNHVAIAYYLDDVEAHSAKFYTACLTEPDVMSCFLDQLTEDVENALFRASTPKLRALFETPSPFTTEEPSEPEYVWNTQPILDAAPTIPGLVKTFSMTTDPDDAYYTVQYLLSDGTGISSYSFNPETVTRIFAGTFNPSDDVEHETFTEAMHSALEELETKGFILRKDLAA